MRRTTVRGGNWPIPMAAGGAQILLTLADGKGRCPTELAESISSSSASITGMIDTLCGAGYANRRHDTEDRRKVIVSITEKGAEFVTRVRQIDPKAA